MDRKTVILMLSGGRDSFLAACNLLESSEKYNIKMVTFDNGCLYGVSNAHTVANRIIEKYGNDRTEYLGVYKTGGIVREFFFPYFNMKPTEQENKFMGMTPSQFHCLICRTSMYICAIWLGQKFGAEYIAEGGRKNQEFVIELPGMAKERYPELVKSVGMQLLLPVYAMESDWDRDNELLRRGFLCKTLEAKCLIGVPVNGSIDQSVIDGVHAYYDEVILPQIRRKNLLSLESAEKYMDPNYDELK